MAFLLADSFQASLEKLNGDEQKAAKLAALELQINPANPGLQCHRLDNIKDKNFWSARASRDIRLIFHRVEGSVMLCCVGHHDPAYDWASRHKIETHPVTGAAQIVEIRETVREIQLPLLVSPESAAAPAPSRPLSKLTEADLLSYGVPAEWIPDVRTADDDLLLVIASHLPGEAAEAIIDLATGTTPAKPEVRPPDHGNPYVHPDAQRRFRVLTGTEELARALDYPWERWIVFLHPSQADWVGRSFNGPTRVQGSAGTGKTNARTSPPPSYACSPQWPELELMSCFLRVISASASSSSPSPGPSTALTSAVARAPCASTTAPPTRSAGKLMCCSIPNPAT